MGSLLKRHSLPDRMMHWFNCVCWLLLFLTGMALLVEPAPLGRGFSEGFRAMLGGGEALLRLHIGTGVLWVLGSVLYVVCHFKGFRVFIREIFRVEKGDLTWIMRKPFVMLLGEHAARLGIPTELPAQGYYNIGQKLFGSCAIIGSIILALTGFFMAAAAFAMLPAEYQPYIQPAIVIHFLAAVTVFLGLLVHVYMAAISPDEKPGLVSMFTGTVPVDYAMGHHRIWAERELSRKG